MYKLEGGAEWRILVELSEETDPFPTFLEEGEGW
jgi:hypothetical protein